MEKNEIKSKKKILILATGGTLASKMGENGLTPQITPEEILRFIPTAKEIYEIDAISVFSIDSTDVTQKHWSVLAGEIEKDYEKYDGFLIIHGTDTLAYTASAVSYMIQNSKKPIVLTGSQLPIDKEKTDAKDNILNSLIYAVDDDSHNVSVVFDGKVIAGTRARKEKAKSFDAFSSLNYPVKAEVKGGKLIRYIPDELPENDVIFYKDMSDSVCTLKLIPGIRPIIFPYLFEHYDAIVIESFGLGGMPENLYDAFCNQMEKWKDKGKTIVITTQVSKEGSDMSVYEVGRKIKDNFNILESFDMTFEATVTKLMWILGRGINDAKTIKSEFYNEINKDILKVN